MRIITAAIVALAMPAVAATPQLVANAGDGAQVRLYQHQEPCLGQARYAEFVHNSKTTPGCWKTDGVVVFVVYFDGDIGRVPVAAFVEPDRL